MWPCIEPSANRSETEAKDHSGIILSFDKPYLFLVNCLVGHSFASALLKNKSQFARKFDNNAFGTAVVTYHARSNQVLNGLLNLPHVDTSSQV